MMKRNLARVALLGACAALALAGCGPRPAKAPAAETMTTESATADAAAEPAAEAPVDGPNDGIAPAPAVGDDLAPAAPPAPAAP